MRAGSEAHKELFCRSFIATHREFDPEKLPWPDLDGSALERLRGLPFWEEAVATGIEAGVKISAYAAQVRDSSLREAIASRSEELRRAALPSTLITRYDVRIMERPTAQLPVNLERAFVDIGYGGCIDSFFAFGLFAVARQSGFFPKPLLDVVEPILDEEARHIVFFANWEAYQRYQQGNGLAPLRAARAMRHYGRAVRRRLVASRSSNGVGFTMSGPSRITVDLTPRAYLQVCLRENDRGLAQCERDLLRPRFVPLLAGSAWRSLRMVSRGAEGSVPRFLRGDRPWWL